MVTSKSTEMQTGEEITVLEAIKQITGIEVEEDEGAPLEGLINSKIGDIYKRLKPEDQRLSRQFKKFHKMYYKLHGHGAPSHQLMRAIIFG